MRALALALFLSCSGSLSAQAGLTSISPEDRTKLELLLREGSSIVRSWQERLDLRELQLTQTERRISERESALALNEADLTARRSDLALRERTLSAREQSLTRIETTLDDLETSLSSASLSLRRKDLELWIYRGVAIVGVALGIYGLVRAAN
jgi:uncharacterized protein (DUF3084 family)